jgi:hypothetical protein
MAHETVFVLMLYVHVIGPPGHPAEWISKEETFEYESDCIAAAAPEALARFCAQIKIPKWEDLERPRE